MARDSLLRQGAGENAVRRYPLWRLALANIIDLLRLLRESWFALLGFALLTIGAALYLRFLYRPSLPSLVDAFYESLRLLIFQSSLPLPSDWVGEVLFFVAPVVGLLLVIQSVVTFGRGFVHKGTRLQSWQISLAATYREHVIVCGLGRVGVRVVRRLLEAGYAPVVIQTEWETQGTTQALRMRVPVIVGDARDPLVLRQAGVTRARAVIASIDGDPTNIEIALVARSLKPTIRVVLRAFSDELDADLRQTFGPSSAYSSSGLAAPTFFAASISREIVYVFPTGPGADVVAVTEARITEGSPLASSVASIEDTYGVRVMRLRSAPLRTIGRAQARPGDTVTLVGALDRLEAARLANRPADAQILQHPDATHDTVIIAGLGKVGFRVARRLNAMRHPPRIVVIDRDLGHSDLITQVREMANVTIIQGDAADPAILRSAGLERAYSIAALSSDDESNLRIGLAARGIRPDAHVALRVFSHTLARELAPLFGIHTAYSTSELSSPTLALAGAMGGVQSAFFSGGRPYVTIERTAQAGDSFVGATVADIRQRASALVIGLRRDGVLTLVPALTLALQPGDKLTLLGLASDLAQLR